MNILLKNKIARVGTDAFDPTRYTVGEEIKAPDAIMVRSASLHNEGFSDNLLAIARCGAGVNNIPTEACAERGIVVFNTPGANANGVKELAIAALLLASRDIVGGIEWARTLEIDVAGAVEKGKSRFAGGELGGKTLGVIGLGAIGGMVANAAVHLGMEVLGYDPFLTVNAAWSLSRAVHKAASYEDVYRSADYITLHVPATPTTRGMINRETISMMKNGVRIVNLARADLVDPDAIRDALKVGRVAAYVTDFPTEGTQGVPGILSIPHLGASTSESEDNCAVMAAHQLDEYLTSGNIRNSVNFPSVSLPFTDGTHRICVLHRNVPNILSHITSMISAEGINIENLANGSRGDYAYTIVEVLSLPSEQALTRIAENDSILRVRAL